MSSEQEPHRDTSGDYEAALKGLVSGQAQDEEGQQGLELGALHPAPHAVKHPWLSKLTPALNKLTVREHLGNYVAVTRGSNPDKAYESMPIYVRVGMHILYSAHDSLLGTTKLRHMLKEQSIEQGKAFDEEKGAFEHIQSFVKTYEIDCSDLLKPNIADYKTFNEFFYRALRDGARPVADKGDDKVISSAADCRLTVFESVDLAKEFWIKGKNFTIGNLLQDDSLASSFDGAALAIFRLAPADYHRFHAPVTATIGPTKNIEGEYFTVNPAAVNENLDVFTCNKRDVTILSLPRPGSTPLDVAFVAVGAMLVGSITHTKNQGDTVERGEELGYFAYGGSTVIGVFPPGSVKWDEDLVENSKGALETLVKVGDHIGVFV
ncbi:hypothetical protein T439DRAFT_305015 [Meredithblackwellia eburnea MCA 4105]